MDIGSSMPMASPWRMSMGQRELGEITWGDYSTRCAMDHHGSIPYFPARSSHVLRARRPKGASPALAKRVDNGNDGMAETSTIEMQDRELFAAMAMQALITREGSA